MNLIQIIVIAKMRLGCSSWPILLMVVVVLMRLEQLMLMLIVLYTMDIPVWAREYQSTLAWCFLLKVFFSFSPWSLLRNQHPKYCIVFANLCYFCIFEWETAAKKAVMNPWEVECRCTMLHNLYLMVGAYAYEISLRIISIMLQKYEI